MSKKNSNDETLDSSDYYQKRKALDVVIEDVARVLVRVSECFSNNCGSFNGQNFNRIVINIASIWIVLFSWVFFIIVSSVRGLAWYLVLPGIISTLIFVCSFIYITGLIRAIINAKQGFNEGGIEQRVSAEVLILVTVIIGFFPVGLSLIFAVIDTHEMHSVPSSVASLIQTGVIYCTTFILWVPYAFCSTPRHFFDASNFSF